MEIKKVNPTTKKTHRRKGVAFDTLAQVFRDVREFLFANGTIMRNRVGSDTVESGDATPSDSVFELYDKRQAVNGKYNLMFLGMNGRGRDRNTNYIQLNADIKDSEADNNPANGQLLLTISRDGVTSGSSISIADAKILLPGLGIETGERISLFGSGPNTADDGGGIQLGYASGGVPVYAVVCDRDGIQMYGLPTSNPGGSNRIWSDGGTLKIT